MTFKECDLCGNVEEEKDNAELSLVHNEDQIMQYDVCASCVVRLLEIIGEKFTRAPKSLKKKGGKK